MTMCELCGFDATYYGQTVRLVERLTICAGCFLDIADSEFGAPDADHLLDVFATDYVSIAA
jgi:hypothetical protein